MYKKECQDQRARTLLSRQPEKLSNRDGQLCSEEFKALRNELLEHESPLTVFRESD